MTQEERMRDFKIFCEYYGKEFLDINEKGMFIPARIRWDNSTVPPWDYEQCSWYEVFASIGALTPDIFCKRLRESNFVVFEQWSRDGGKSDTKPRELLWVYENQETYKQSVLKSLEELKDFRKTLVAKAQSRKGKEL